MIKQEPGDLAKLYSNVFPYMHWWYNFEEIFILSAHCAQLHDINIKESKLISKSSSLRENQTVIVFMQ